MQLFLLLSVQLENKATPTLLDYLDRSSELTSKKSVKKQLHYVIAFTRIVRLQISHSCNLVPIAAGNSFNN